MFLIRTVDHTPPAFTGGTPYVQNIQATAFDVVVQQNKTGRVYYVVVEQVSPLTAVVLMSRGQCLVQSPNLDAAYEALYPMHQACTQWLRCRCSSADCGCLP